jgi:N-acetylmuramoyl-L-alanine amidase
VLGVGVLVWGLAAVPWTDRAPAVATDTAGPRPPVEAPPTTGGEVVAHAQEARPPAPPPEAPAITPPSSPAPRAAPERRGGRRSRRNVWVGPIPGPADWAPPEGPVRIALQAGHWRADEAPAELSGLKDNGTAAQGTAEWEVNLDIAQRAAALLQGMGYVVDVLPAVVPPSYRAHLFISIHADGSGDPRASGFRVASPRNDQTGRAARAARLLEQSYADATGIDRLPSVTRRMQNYYAFNFRRYVHALHPMTIGVILETGFLTSASDRRVILDDPDRAARGIAAAVVAFPLTPPPGPAITLADVQVD